MKGIRPHKRPRRRICAISWSRSGWSRGSPPLKEMMEVPRSPSRLMRRSIFDRFTLEKNSGVICLELMKKVHDAGCRIAEVPVHHYHRAHGRSQFFNVRRLIRTAIDVMKLWFVLVVRHEHLRGGAEGVRPVRPGARG